MGKLMQAAVCTLVLLVLGEVPVQAEEKQPAAAPEERAPVKKPAKKKAVKGARNEQAAKTRNPEELVSLLENASVAELQKLPFTELNILKNAVFASRGYVFADDRPWLNLLYCGEPYFSQHVQLFQRLVQFPASDVAQFTGDTADSFMSTQRGDAFRITKWDLRAYRFPACRDSGALDEHQKKAIATLHVALLKKVEAFKSTADMDLALKADVDGRLCGYYSSVLLGKALREEALKVFETSLRRDLHGYYRLMKLIRQGEVFDQMELLGLYAGDIVFLKNVLEAQQGKPFSGVLGWEISQVIGVSEQKQDYDPSRLPPDMQQRLKSLDDIVIKIMRSGLKDVPASLRSRPIEFSNPYELEGC